jgi:hypothetical protein
MTHPIIQRLQCASHVALLSTLCFWLVQHAPALSMCAAKLINTAVGNILLDSHDSRQAGITATAAARMMIASNARSS